MKVSIKSSNGLKKLSHSIEKSNIKVVAGVFSGATNSDTGQKVAQYAQMLEFGTSRMPPRPFLQTTVKESAGEWKEAIAEGLRERGVQSAKPVLGEVGRLMAADIRSTIRKGNFEPLSEETIEAKQRKGRPEPEAPLIDTTSLIRSIRSEVRGIK